jgi:uncharacterized OB-fold protein
MIEPVPDVSRHRRPRPVATTMTQPFWEGTRAGKLLLQRCRDCGHWRWTPQLACPACWSEAYDWSETSGRGSLYSYTLIHRPVDPARFEAPYLLAVVTLEEGPHMLTNLVECTPDQARIGMPVEVRFERLDDEFTVYPFAPVKAAPPASRGD